MKHISMNLLIASVVALLAVTLTGGCASRATKHATSVVDFLFPDTKDPVVTPEMTVLTLPLRVGIAFVPADSAKGGRGSQSYSGPASLRAGALGLTEKRKADLMQEVANHFKKYPYVKEIEIIPSAYLKPGGSFANLDQIRTMYGLDVIALLSYDQAQFTDEGVASFTYWTIVGAYIVPGEKNSTHTMIDAVVYDIPSRKMLFRAPGMSLVKGLATPVNLSQELRADSDMGFNDAAKEMIVNLDEQLAHFKEKVKERPKEYKIVHTPQYTGGGSIDMISLILLAGLGGYFLWMQKRN